MPHGIEGICMLKNVLFKPQKRRISSNGNSRVGGDCPHYSAEVYPPSLLGLNNGEFPVMEILESAAVVFLFS